MKSWSWGVEAESETMPSFEWKIDALTLRAFKETTNTQSFNGPTFNAFGGTIRLIVYPNGHSAPSVGKIYPEVYWALSEEQKEEVIKIAVAVVVSCIEANKAVAGSVESDSWQGFSYAKDIAKLSDIQQYDSITIKLEIGMIQVLSETDPSTTKHTDNE